MFNKHPKGLIPAALSNMGERFGYYIMNAVLVLFLCSKFGISEEKSTLIYSFFYAGIYLLSLVGGLIADRKQNYKGTIMAGLVVMAIGYIALSIPITANAGNTSWLLTLTCIALFFIAFGNGLFKGNLQDLVIAWRAWKIWQLRKEQERFWIPDLLCVYQYRRTGSSVYCSSVEKLVAECTRYGL